MHFLTNMNHTLLLSMKWVILGFDMIKLICFLIRKSEEFPKFDERFAGYGMNKVTHITELFAAK